jgi:hypothetical protein
MKYLLASLLYLAWLVPLASYSGIVRAIQLTGDGSLSLEFKLLAMTWYVLGILVAGMVLQVIRILEK